MQIQQACARFFQYDNLFDKLQSLLLKNINMLQIFTKSKSTTISNSLYIFFTCGVVL
jgi:hypothetical protein